MKLRVLFCYFVVCTAFCGCKNFLQEVGPQEYGIVFSSMPSFIGGGLSDAVLEPGAGVFIFPWEKLYTVNTGVQSIVWGPENTGDNEAVDDSLATRALDGNEVALAVTIKYRIRSEAVRHVIERVGTNNIRNLVEASARADIRTHLNTLRTKGFIDPALRDGAFLQVTEALNYRLKKEGIEVLLVDYNGHRFERKTKDGRIDSIYQEKIDDAQQTLEALNKEPESRDARLEDKKRIFEEASGEMNKLIEQAKGYERAAQARADNYLVMRQFDAERIRTKGLMEVEGIQKQIEALSGKGGSALLRLKIARELVKTNPSFVLIHSGDQSAGEVNVKRIDTNELIEQIGLFAVQKEGFRETSEVTVESAAPKVAVERH